MKLLLQSLGLFLILIYLADIKITFRPFSITADRWMHVVGIVAIVSGCILIKSQSYKDGLKRGAEIKKEAIKEVIEEIEQDNIKSGL